MGFYPPLLTRCVGLVWGGSAGGGVVGVWWGCGGWSAGGGVIGVLVRVLGIY